MIASLIALLVSFQPDAVAQGDIVVTGTRPSAEVIHSYVRTISQPVGGQLARYRTPICPGVVGLGGNHADRIVGRIRTVAREVGAAVAPRDCTPNLMVVFTDNGEDFIQELYRQRPIAFIGLTKAERDRLLDWEGSVVSWSSTQVLNEDGNAVSQDYGDGDESGGVMRVSRSSIIGMTTQQAIVDSVIVIEHGAAAGKSVAQLGDYAAIRALAGLRPPKEEVPGDSIVNLFEEGVSQPRSLTQLDMAYLKALYRAPVAQPAPRQMSRIAQSMENALTQQH